MSESSIYDSSKDYGTIATLVEAIKSLKTAASMNKLSPKYAHRVSVEQGKVHCAAMKALPALEAVSAQGWQDISTAPKDRPVWVFPATGGE